MAEVPGLQIQKIRECIWVTIPRYIDINNDLHLENRIVSELTGKSDKLVLDLINNDNIYSMTISLIMHLRARMVEIGGSMCIINASKECLEKLQQLQLNKVLKIYENDEEINTDC